MFAFRLEKCGKLILTVKRDHHAPEALLVFGAKLVVELQDAFILL